MRVPAAFVLTMAAILAPGLGKANPAHPQPMTGPASASETPSPNAVPSATAAATVKSAQAPNATAKPGAEQVVVHGKAQNDNVADSLNAIVCHNAPPPIGSRLGGALECYTIRQWNDRKRDARRSLENIQMRALSFRF
jgi:hypothetical protein